MLAMLLKNGTKHACHISFVRGQICLPSFLKGTRYACNVYQNWKSISYKAYSPPFKSDWRKLCAIKKTSFILWTISWPIMILPYDMWQTFNWMTWDMNNLVCYMPYFWHWFEAWNKYGAHMGFNDTTCYTVTRSWIVWLIQHDSYCMKILYAFLSHLSRTCLFLNIFEWN